MPWKTATLAAWLRSPSHWLRRSSAYTSDTLTDYVVHRMELGHDGLPAARGRDLFGGDRPVLPRPDGPWSVFDMVLPGRSRSDLHDDRAFAQRATAAVIEWFGRRIVGFGNHRFGNERRGGSSTGGGAAKSNCERGRRTRSFVPPPTRMVLLIVLIVVALLGLAAYTFAELMLTEYRAAIVNQRQAQARAHRVGRRVFAGVPPRDG